MNQSDSDLLNQVYVKTPCNIDWDSMQGDDRMRFCGKCSLNVYNVANLTEKEAAELLRNTEPERVCMRLYRRQDGTIITDNCPVGLRKLRNRIRLQVSLILALMVSVNLMQNAQAQGLIGAPTMGGISRTADYVPMPEESKSDLVLVSGITASAAAIWIKTHKQSSLAFVSMGLITIFALAGAFTCLSAHVQDASTSPDSCNGYNGSAS